MDLRHLYTSFDGRINRQPYWIASIPLAVLNVVISISVAKLLGASIMDFRFKLVSLVFAMLFLYPAAALMVKRLHDRDRPGWLAALLLAPPLIQNVLALIGTTGNQSNPNVLVVLLGGIFALVFGIVNIWAFIELGCLRGTDGPNQYGPDPLGGSEQYYNKCSACGKFTRGATVCRHCHHNLTDSVSDTPQIEAQQLPPTTSGALQTDVTTTKVRCVHCQHVQTVPVSHPTFVCEQCNAHLKRRPAPGA